MKKETKPIISKALLLLSALEGEVTPFGTHLHPALRRLTKALPIHYRERTRISIEERSRMFTFINN